MFDSIGWPEILVLVVAGLFILGPERLPDAARWLAKTIGQVKSFATGAQAQIRSEVGSDFDAFAKPLNDLQRLRGRDPRRVAFDALMRDDDTPRTSRSMTAPPARTAPNAPATPARASTPAPAPVPAPGQPAAPGSAPVDYDAT